MLADINPDDLVKSQRNDGFAFRGVRPDAHFWASPARPYIQSAPILDLSPFLQEILLNIHAITTENIFVFRNIPKSQMRDLEGIVLKVEMRLHSRFIQIGFIIFLILSHAGCATLPAGPKETVRAFPDFAAVVAQEGDTFSSLSAKYLKDPSWDWLIAEDNEIDSLKPGQPLLIPLKPDKRGGLTIRGYQIVPVLRYHNFSATESNKQTLSQAVFDQQMRFLKENGYRVISMDQFFDFLEFKVSIPPKSVVLTIDEGWFSAHEIAFPILKKYGYPATLFVYTEMISKSSKTLSWKQLQEMAAGGMEVHCHAKIRRNLAVMDKKKSFKENFETLERELSSCRDTIKKNLNREVKYLAYPYGDTNSLVIEVAKKLGYRGGLTVKRGGNPFFVHHFRVNRSEVFGDFTLSQFEKNLAVFQEQTLR